MKPPSLVQLLLLLLGRAGGAILDGQALDSAIITDAENQQNVYTYTDTKKGQAKIQKRL